MRRAALTAALAVSAGLVAACGGSASPANLISVSNGGCGTNWHAGPGWYTFQIYNAAAEAVEVDLVNPASGGVYAEVETIGPGTSSPMRLDLGSGPYAFRCLFQDYDPISGPTTVVGGHAGGTPAIVPITNNDLLGPAKEYHAYVTAGLITLLSQADGLAADVRAGNLGAARSAWLPAHLTYERLGAAYDSFGSFDEAIDGRPDGLADGVGSPQWTGLWNYAQNYAMSDNNYDANFGPSTPGALNVISGNNGGGYAVNPTTGAVEAAPGSVSTLNSNGLGTVYGDLDPAYDDCSDTSHTSTNPVGVMTGQNIGNLLNAKNITWGWFQGGFAPTGTNAAGYAVCGSAHENIGGNLVTDYVPHHNPFQYYKSTANPKHLPPSSEAAIGHTDQANHQYDLSLFYDTLKDGNMPSVSFLKAPAYQDGHAGYSNPIDEQHFLVNAINAIEQSKFWKSTAIIVTYDDSDGWYDHQAPPIVNGSDTPADEAICNTVAMTLGTFNTRCGYGPRLPLVVISPYTRTNYVSSNLTDQASVVRFIEDNWLGGERLGGGSFDAISGSLYAKGGVLNFRVRPNFRPVILNPITGEVVSG